MPLMILNMEYLCCLANSEGPSKRKVAEEVLAITDHYIASTILHGMEIPPMKWSRLIRRGSGTEAEEQEGTEEYFKHGQSAV